MRATCKGYKRCVIHRVTCHIAPGYRERKCHQVDDLPVLALLGKLKKNACKLHASSREYIERHSTCFDNGSWKTECGFVCQQGRGRNSAKPMYLGYAMSLRRAV